MKTQKLKLFIVTAVASMIIFPSVSIGAETREAPTVADCVEKTGKSDSECAEMINNFKNRRPPGGEIGNRDSGKPPMEKNLENIRGGSHPQNINMGSIDNRIENAKKMKDDKKKRFAQTEEKIQKLIDYIKSQNIDTAEIENNLAAFKEKADEILSAFDTYIQALKNYKSDDSSDNSAKIRDARENIRTLSGKLAAFYRSSIREAIKTLIDRVED
jgi:hypothetical protein